MKEYDDIENLFSDTFSGEEIQPPRKVKNNLDDALFPDSSRGAWTILRHYMWLLPLLFLVTTSSIYIVNDDEIASNDISLSSVDGKVASQKLDVKNDERITGAESQFQTRESWTENEETEHESNENKKNELSIDPIESLDPVDRGVKSNDDNGRKSAGDKVDLSKKGDLKDDTDLYKGDDNEGDLLVDKGGKTIDDPKVKKVEDEQGPLVVEKPFVWLPFIGLEPLTESDNRPKWSDSEAENYLKKKNGIPLELSAYFGPSNGLSSYMYEMGNQSNSVIDFRETMGMEMSFEVATPIGKKWNIATGLAYSANTSEFYATTFSIDSTFLGFDSTIIYGPNWPQDTIIDTILYFDQYEYMENEVFQSSFVRLSSISIPVYIQTNISIMKALDLRISAGALLSYNRYRFTSNELGLENNFNSFSANLMIRPELIYRIGRVGVSVYGKFGYDVRNGYSNQMGRLSRFNYGSGVSLKYSF